MGDSWKKSRKERSFVEGELGGGRGEKGGKRGVLTTIRGRRRDG